MRILSSGKNRFSVSASAIVVVTLGSMKVPIVVSVKLTSAPVSLPSKSVLPERSMGSPTAPLSANVGGLKRTVYSLTSFTLPGASTSSRKLRNGSKIGLSLVTLTTAWPSGRRSTVNSTVSRIGDCSKPARANASEEASLTCISSSSLSVAERIAISASRV